MKNAARLVRLSVHVSTTYMQHVGPEGNVRRQIGYQYVLVLLSSSHTEVQLSMTIKCTSP